ncbi:hypothetical protein ACFY84_27600 [Streptomyces sp. NPDC012438]|uniref:hypothetical protein n=1 Tax=Streptomyces sp. NPDC012438 TaxID=3364833 RepID=UPI0036E233AE
MNGVPNGLVNDTEKDLPNDPAGDLANDRRNDLPDNPGKNLANGRAHHSAPGLANDPPAVTENPPAPVPASAPEAAARPDPPELSCYTAALVAYLEPELPDAADRLAGAVRLAVRTDHPSGRLAFSHHHRIDLTAGSGGLVHRGAAHWPEALAALRAEAGRNGRVLAVANTRTVPWSPACGTSTAAHWILLEPVPGGPGAWRVTDRFAALLPEGEQHPHTGVVDDTALRSLLTPLGALAPQYALRDVHALGEASETPAPDHYGWLARRSARAATAPPEGRWLHEPSETLGFLADRLGADPVLLAAHADDLWAAARHQRHRLDLLARTGAVSRTAAETAADAWGELPRSLRFAVTSAERGRPRPGVVARAFAGLVAAATRVQKEEQR